MRVAAIVALIPLAVAAYTENLNIKPLARNRVLASFEFHDQSPPLPLRYTNTSQDLYIEPRHYGLFPRALEPVIRATNTRELHLRFTQGWWDTEAWGRLPHDGSATGGTGVELWAAIEAPDIEAARQNWRKLAESLSGFFCALMNFIDDLLTTYPLYDAATGLSFVAGPAHGLYWLRAALPDEPICTENLTPFLKLLPTRGKAGVASILDGHKLYDSLWHSMSIDLVTSCVGDECSLDLSQNIHHIIDVPRLLRRKREGGIPKPTAGDSLRCDETKRHDAWVCFPLNEDVEVEWDLEQLFGRGILGPGLQDSSNGSTLTFELLPEFWAVLVEKDGQWLNVEGAAYTIADSGTYNFKFKTSDSRKVAPVSASPVLVSRSLTGYSQDKGGLRVRIANKSPEPLRVTYFDTLPWFMRVYLHTLEFSGAGNITRQFYKPAIDHSRPGHFELEILLSPGQDLTFTYQFDKSLLVYYEYPPDANHGFAVAPAVIRVLGEDDATLYQMRTASLLLTLPVPDFSMPYNVIILTCTVMSLAFGTIFNLLVKKVVTEEEFETASKESKLTKLKEKVAGLKRRLKAT